MTPLVELERQLDAADVEVRFAACWYGFDLGMRLADSAAWEDGVDEVAAFAAGSACAAGRSLLPLPASGAPIPLDAVGPGELAVLLARAEAVLDTAARRAEGADEVAAWHTAAAKAHDAAECLRAMRGPG